MIKVTDGVFFTSLGFLDIWRCLLLMHSLYVVDPSSQMFLFSARLGGRIHHHFFLFPLQGRESKRKTRFLKKKKKGHNSLHNPIPFQEPWRCTKFIIQSSSWGPLLFHCVLHTCSLNAIFFFFFFSYEFTHFQSLLGLHNFVSSWKKFSVFLTEDLPLVHAK